MFSAFDSWRGGSPASASGERLADSDQRADQRLFSILAPGWAATGSPSKDNSSGAPRQPSASGGAFSGITDADGGGVDLASDIANLRKALSSLGREMDQSDNGTSFGDNAGSGGLYSAPSTPAARGGSFYQTPGRMPGPSSIDVVSKDKSPPRSPPRSPPKSKAMQMIGQQMERLLQPGPSPPGSYTGSEPSGEPSGDRIARLANEVESLHRQKAQLERSAQAETDRLRADLEAAARQRIDFERASAEQTRHLQTELGRISGENEGIQRQAESQMAAAHEALVEARQRMQTAEQKMRYSVQESDERVLVVEKQAAERVTAVHEQTEARLLAAASSAKEDRAHYESAQEELAAQRRSMSDALSAAERSGAETAAQNSELVEALKRAEAHVGAMQQESLKLIQDANRERDMAVQQNADNARSTEQHMHGVLQQSERQNERQIESLKMQLEELLARSAEEMSKTREAAAATLIVERQNHSIAIAEEKHRAEQQTEDLAHQHEKALREAEQLAEVKMGNIAQQSEEKHKQTIDAVSRATQHAERIVGEATRQLDARVAEVERSADLRVSKEQERGRDTVRKARAQTAQELETERKRMGSEVAAVRVAADQRVRGAELEALKCKEDFSKMEFDSDTRVRRAEAAVSSLEAMNRIKTESAGNMPQNTERLISEATRQLNTRVAEVERSADSRVASEQERGREMIRTVRAQAANELDAERKRMSTELAAVQATADQRLRQAETSAVLKVGTVPGAMASHNMDRLRQQVKEARSEVISVQHDADGKLQRAKAMFDEAESMVGSVERILVSLQGHIVVQDPALQGLVDTVATELSQVRRVVHLNHGNAPQKHLAENGAEMDKLEAELNQIKAGQAELERQRGRQEAQAASTLRELAMARAETEDLRARKTKAEGETKRLRAASGASVSGASSQIRDLERALALAEEEASLSKAMANEVTRNVNIRLKHAEQQTLKEKKAEEDHFRQQVAQIDKDALLKLSKVRSDATEAVTAARKVAEQVQAEFQSFRVVTQAEHENFTKHKKLAEKVEIDFVQYRSVTEQERRDADTQIGLLANKLIEASKTEVRLVSHIEEAERHSLQRIEEAQTAAVLMTKEASQLAMSAIEDANKLEEARREAEAMRSQLELDQERQHRAEKEATIRQLGDELMDSQKVLEGQIMLGQTAQNELKIARAEAESLLDAGQNVVAELDKLRTHAATERSETAKSIGNLRETFEGKMGDLRKEIHTQRNLRNVEAQQRHEQLEELHTERDRLLEQLAEARTESSGIREQQGALKRKLEGVTAEMRDNRAENEENEAMVLMMQSKLADNILEMNSLQQRLIQSQENWRKARASLAEAEPKLVAYERAVEELKKVGQLDNARHEADQQLLRQALSGQEGRYTELQESARAASLKYQSELAQMKTLAEANLQMTKLSHSEALDQQLGELKLSHASAINDMEQSHAAAVQGHSDFQNELTDRHSALQSDSSSLQSRLQAELSELRTAAGHHTRETELRVAEVTVQMQGQLDKQLVDKDVQIAEMKVELQTEVGKQVAAKEKLHEEALRHSVEAAEKTNEEDVKRVLSMAEEGHRQGQTDRAAAVQQAVAEAEGRGTVVQLEMGKRLAEAEQQVDVAIQMGRDALQATEERATAVQAQMAAKMRVAVEGLTQGLQAERARVAELEEVLEIVSRQRQAEDQLEDSLRAGSARPQTPPPEPVEEIEVATPAPAQRMLWEPAPADEAELAGLDPELAGLPASLVVEAAVRLQAAQRGMSARAGLYTQHDSAIVIQTVVRRRQAQAGHSALRVSVLVVRMQAAGRGWLVRKEQLMVDVSAAQIQAAVRRRQAQTRYSTAQLEPKIPAELAGLDPELAVLPPSLLGEAAIKLQAAQRGLAAREELQIQHAAATKVQTSARQRSAVAETAARRTETAADTLSAAGRGFLVRKRQREAAESAARIQAVARRRQVQAQVQVQQQQQQQMQMQMQIQQLQQQQQQAAQQQQQQQMQQMQQQQQQQLQQQQQQQRQAAQQQRLAAQQVPRSPWSSPAGVPPPPLTPKPPPSPAAASNYASSPPPRAAVAAFNGTASPIASVASVSSGSPGSSAGGSGTKKKKRFSWSAIDGGKAGPLLKPKTFEEEMAAALASPAPPYSPHRVPPPPTSPKPAGMRSPAAAAGGGASSQPPLEAALAQMYDQLAATDAEFSRLLQATKPPRQSPWGAQPSSVSPQRGSSSEAED